MAKVVCGCGKSVETKPEWAGQWISCPGCNGTLYAPFPGDKPAPPVPVIEVLPPAPALPAEFTKLCPWCAETIPGAAAVCPICKGDAQACPAANPPMPLSRPQSSTDSGGMTPLVVGLLAFLFCQLAGPVAWAMGSSYEKECRARGVAPSGAGTAGKILGIVATVFLFIALAFMVLGTVVSSGSK
ncbi:MAG TPA: hypothetical protein VG457_19315 [Planctomycetota bacterium]|jgi:hypothetical protein|nr:hypothetical protein [Planctomycetota bacterium]